jgi:hypothetical protein
MWNSTPLLAASANRLQRTGFDRGRPRPALHPELFIGTSPADLSPVVLSGDSDQIGLNETSPQLPHPAQPSSQDGCMFTDSAGPLADEASLHAV